MGRVDRSRVAGPSAPGAIAVGNGLPLNAAVAEKLRESADLLAWQGANLHCN
jgi:hypothetical protein